MLTHKVSVHRKARYAARLADNTRSHGRRRGYEHARRSDAAPERSSGVPLVPFLALGAVLLFIGLVIAGAMAPPVQPLVKHEPVSTARVR